MQKLRAQKSLVKVPCLILSFISTCQKMLSYMSSFKKYIYIYIYITNVSKSLIQKEKKLNLIHFTLTTSSKQKHKINVFYM